MSVVIETTLGDMTVDLFLAERPIACLNFLKLCKIKYYNYNLFHTISRGFIAQTGDPTGSRKGGESIYGVLDGEKKRYFEGENEPRLKHTKMGLISFVGNEERMIGSQFFLTLGEDLTYLDLKHCVFGEIVEGLDILEVINEVICDTDDRPYQDVRITHTVILDDPYPDPKRLKVPSRSPSPSTERLQGGRIAPDEEIDETEEKTVEEIMELQAEREAKARANILEMVGDLPDADMAPPENVLFVCKLNPVTSDDDLEIIFNRFGKILSCEVIRDKKTGDSLQYAFIEFEDQKACEDAYFKMDNILIDDRRIHVDFSQSVSKVKWLGKGRGVRHYDEKGKITSHGTNEIGKGNYKTKSRDQNRDLSPPSTNDSNTTKKYSQKNDFIRTDSNRIREDVRPRSPRRNHDYDLDTQSNRNGRQYREYSPYRNKDDSRRDKRHRSVSRSPVRHRIDDIRYRESYGSRGRYNDRDRSRYDDRDRSRYDGRDRSRYVDRDRSRYDNRDRSRYESRNYDLMRQTSRYERNGLSSSRYSEKQERSHTYRTSTKSHYDYSKRNSFVNEDDSKYSKKEKDISIKNKKTDTESSSDENKKQSQNKTAFRKNRTKTTVSKKKKKVSSSDSESSSDSDSTSSSSSSDTEKVSKSKKNKNERKNKSIDISSSEDKSHRKGKNKKKKPKTESSSSETDSDSSKSESSESEDEKQGRKRLKKRSKERSDHSDEEIKKNKKKNRKRD